MNLPGAVVIAVVLCVISACAYATGALLQQRVAQQPMRVLLRTPIWWAAIASNGVGALLHVAALRSGPLALVQALGVLTLVVAVPMGAIAARRRLSHTEGGATALAAISLLGLTALFGSTPATALDGRRLVALLLVITVALVPLAGRAAAANGLAAAAGGGVAFGVASAVTQTLSVRITDAGLAALIAPAGVLSVLAVAGLNVAGVWFTQLSYRHGLAAPLAVSTIANPVAATTIGMLLLGETLRGGAIGLLVAAVCVAGVTVAVRQLTVAQQLLHGAPAGARKPSGPPVRPRHRFGYDRPRGRSHDGLTVIVSGVSP